jgi:N6-adenosine-specific RNA methylase IME4
MSDHRLTKLTADLLVAARDQVDHLIGAGLVDKEQLRVTLAPAARKAKVNELHQQGLSQRKIAKVVGVTHETVRRDLGVANAPENGANAPLEIPLEAPAPRGEKEILSTAHEIQMRKWHEKQAAAVEKTSSVEFNAALLGRFAVILADPPWRHENSMPDRAIENHYPTMPLEEICALPVVEIAHEDSVLFLWATAPKLAECMRVIEAWGFEYRTGMVWAKDKFGTGYYVRNQHEHLLICKRGQLPIPPPSARCSSLIEAPRLEHSAKPEIVYDIIDAMYPGLRKIELFSRNSRHGWAAWGNQAGAP